MKIQSVLKLVGGTTKAKIVTGAVVATLAVGGVGTGAYVHHQQVAKEAEEQQEALAEAKAEVSEVETLIEEIGEVKEYTVEENAECLYDEAQAERITKAREAYDALSEDEKKDVTNVATLEEAESAMEALNERQGKIAEVEELIAAIGEVNANSREAIESARSAYDALSNDQARVKNADVLLSAETAFAGLTTEDTEETKSAEEKSGTNSSGSTKTATTGSSTGSSTSASSGSGASSASSSGNSTEEDMSGEHPHDGFHVNTADCWYTNGYYSYVSGEKLAEYLFSNGEFSYERFAEYGYDHDAAIKRLAEIVDYVPAGTWYTDGSVCID